MKDKRIFKNKAADPVTLTILGIFAVGGIIAILWKLGVAGIIGKYISNAVLWVLDYISLLVLSAVNFLFNIFAKIASIAIDIFIVLNPFVPGGVAQFLWEFFRNIAYVILVFLAFYSGFNWILNREDQARRILFGVLLIAFLINFTFILAKELFMTVSFIQLNLLKSANLTRDPAGSSAKLGSLIYAAFNTLPPAQVTEQLKILIKTAVAEPNIEPGIDAGILYRALNISANLVGIFLSLIYSITLWAIAGIAIGRYFIISFLAGLLPLAVIAYVTPGYEKYWQSWWRWFINWTINILILIVLILIGIALIATTTTGGISGAFNEESIQNLIEPTLQEQVALGTPSSEGANLVLVFFSMALKYVFLVIYFFIVMKLTLQLGGQFAEYGYGLAVRGWKAIGGAAAGVGMWAAAPGLTKLGGGLRGLGDKLLESKYGVGRRLGLWVKGIGETLEKPAKEQIKKEAEAVWSSLMEGKSPEEIAKIFQNYRGAFREELAKMIGRNLGAEDIAKFAGHLDLQREGAGTIKALCRKLNCALMRLKEGKHAEALSPLADSLDHRKIKLGEIEKLFQQAGAENTDLLLGNYLGFLSNRDIRDLLAHPENLKYFNKLREKGVSLPISKEAQYRIALQSPTVRALEEVGSAFATNLGITDPEQQRLFIQELQSRYSGGDITAETLEGWAKQTKEGKLPSDLQETLQGALNRVRGSLEDRLRKQREALRRIDEEIQKIETEAESKIKELNEEIREKEDRLSRETVIDVRTLAQELEGLREQLSKLEKEKNQKIMELEQQKSEINEEISRLEGLLQTEFPQIPSQITDESKRQEIVNLINKALGIFKHPYGARAGRREMGFEERLRSLEERAERGGSA